MEKEESEFGKGYSYCLGLFLAHEWKLFQMEMKENATSESVSSSYNRASTWFNGAADHLFDLQIPEKLPAEKRKQIADFQSRCLQFRLCMNGEKCEWSDAHAALDEAKDLLREWDDFNGIETIKGGWQ